MARMKETPRYNIISVRITDSEWKVVRSLQETSNVTISDIVRGALSHFIHEVLPTEQEAFSSEVASRPESPRKSLSRAAVVAVPPPAKGGGAGP